MLTSGDAERAPEMFDRVIEKYPNLVTWTLSGTYDEDRPILIDADNPNRFITRKKAQELVLSLAGAFPPDSTVCLHLPNDVLYPVLALAVFASHCRWTGTNVVYHVTELEHHFRLSETRYVITTLEHLDVVDEAVRASGTDAEIILFTDLLETSPANFVESNGPRAPGALSAKHVRTLRDLILQPADVKLEKLTQHISPDSVAVLMQTSGTTGLPKMAARTHRAMLLEQLAIEDNNAQKPYEVRRLYCVPIFHGFAAPDMMFNILRLGQTSYFMKRFDDSFAQKVQDFQITETAGAPPMLLKLVNNPQSHRLLQSLRLISFGGAPLAPSLRKKTLEMFDVAPRIVPVYGMTEGGWFTTLKYPENDDTGSVGVPIPGYSVKMDTQSNTELHDGQIVGELLMKGPQVMEGYLNNEAATAEAFEDGWLKTGDIGFIRDGKVYLVDRAKDVIKVSGFQVAPAELEDALLRSPDISDAAVFGIGQGLDERPLTCVVARTKELTAEKVMAHLRSQLAGYKVGRCEVRFVEAIPKNPSGKILKKELKKNLAE